MKEKKVKKHSVNQSQELEHQLKRALADYANLQKRFEEEKKLITKFANAVLIAKLLEILDGLEAAQKTINSEGLELVIRKFKDIIKSENVTEIVSVGEDFNPEFHEGIGVIEAEEDGKVGEVLQKGYMLGEKVLRPARVRVTQKKVDEG